MTADLLKPGSEWLNGKGWMTLPVQEAQENGTLKSTKDIIINNEMKKVLREGTFFDDFDQLNYTFNHFDAKKSARIESESDYLFSPIKRSFKSVVRITGYVILACKKFKRGLAIAKAKNNEKPCFRTLGIVRMIH